MTTDTSGSDYARGAIIRKRGASLAPTTPPPNDQPLVAPTKVQVVSSSPTILEMEKEGDNDASTVRSPSMRTYREGDDKRLAGFGGFTSIHQQQDQMQNEEVELVPGPVRVSLTDEGVHGSDSQEVPGAQFHTNGQADTTQQFINGEILEKNIVPGSRYVEITAK
ncbi:hypothetical protein QFC19_001397 [Naganishia cerealis]|uniref:Uncharacterized protein n=1 Tax=Naganishia cerealis TaxID=610337 RepID=A0ACC2WGL6_9TREE|nr:hypothetical protein QFC19_001397 [Naganishia cerealis]